MGSQPDSLPVADAVLSGPYWPEWVRVVCAEPRAGGRVRLDMVALDEQSHLISHNFNRKELERLVVETRPGELALDGDPAGFKLAAEATRMRLAYTYDPQFAVSVIRIPLPWDEKERRLLECFLAGRDSVPDAPRQGRLL